MSQVQSYDIPLHDIKPIIEVEEYSLYYFLGVVFISTLFILAVAYLIYMWLRKRNRYNKRKEHLKLLNTLDLNDTKNSAYALTLYGITFRDDSLRHKEMYDNLVARLEGYKYKKEVSSFDAEVLGYIELYRGMVDV